MREANLSAELTTADRHGVVLSEEVAKSALKVATLRRRRATLDVQLTEEQARSMHTSPQAAPAEPALRSYPV